MDFKADIKNYIECEIATLRRLEVEQIDLALNLLLEAQKAHKRIYVFGNGGSSATASHIQNDFGKGISEYVDDKFRFQCLNDNLPTVMAIANDIGFDEIFRFQLIGLLEPGDIIMAISGSGNSQNVIKAVEYAKSQGNKIIGLTGYNGGKLKELSDVSLHVPINSMQVTEDIHMVFDHLMMSMFYKHLCGKSHIS